MPFNKRFAKTKQAPVDQRTQLLRDTMQFLLQRDEQRFSKLLLAQLLDEGCNFPLALAKPLFYALMIEGLRAKLSPDAQKANAERIPIPAGEITHVQFYDAILSFKSSLKHSENQMALQVIDSLAQIKNEWQIDKRFFTEELEPFNARLEAIVKNFCERASAGRLGDVPIHQIRRRLYVALTTSLFKFITDPQQFQSEFGSIPEVLKAIQKNHHVFCRVMAYFSARIPYFTHLASQTFWRTLQTLNTES